MPLSTFYNLARTRQQEILEVCFEEFALNDYLNASVSRIVRHLKLAKGSFYRYFEHKMDLYAYLIDQATLMQVAHVAELEEVHGRDFFDLLIEHLQAKLEYDCKHPLVSGFLYNVMQERNADQLGNMSLHTKFRIMQTVRPMLEARQMQGAIRTDVEVDWLAYVVLQMQIGIYDYLALVHQVDFRENIRKKESVLSLSKEVLNQVVRQFAETLRSGLQA